MKFFAGLATAVLTFASSTAFAATPYRMESILLLQPDFVLRERVPSMDALSDYIKTVQATAGQALSGTPPTPASGYLILAVRPGGQSMVWFDFKPALPEATVSKLRAAILAVPAFEAKHGVVVFALNSSLWDGPSATGFPHPTEWSQVMQDYDEPMEIGDLVDKVWPGVAGP